MGTANNQNRRVLPAVFVTVAIAAGLFTAPPKYTNYGRVFLRDALRPGLVVLDQSRTNAKSTLQSWIADGQPESEVVASTTLENNSQSLRRLQIENAKLHRQMNTAKQIGVAPYRGTPSSPLLNADLLEARVLGEETAGLWRGGLLLNQGGNQSLAESDLVLKDETTLVDAGEHNRLEPGFAVFAGRTVLGRLRQVGHWSSSLEPVTAATFRGYAQLIRKTPQGYKFGATGVIKGTGKSFCRLDMIAVNEPVSVGDGVYTISDGVFPYPMSYGRVSRAEHVSGASHWEIEVEPAAAKARPVTVQILRRRLNPNRGSSDSSERGIPSLSNGSNPIRRPVGN